MECKSIALRIMNIICLSSIMFCFPERGTWVKCCFHQQQELFEKKDLITV